MSKLVSRRGLLSKAAAVAAAGAIPGTAAAIEPPKRAGGPHLRVGCCAYSYRDFLQGKKQPAMTLEDFLNRCAEIGIDGVELTSYYFPTPVRLDYIQKLVRRAFLLGLDINGTAVGNQFTHPPGEARDKEIAKVKEWIDYAVDMGAPCARIFAGPTPKGVSDDQARKWVVECIETCCEYAEKKGVMLALENHGGVVGDSNGVLQILQAVKSDWFGMKWDSGNFHTEDPYADLARCAPYAVTTHMKTDVMRGTTREDADLARQVKILKDAGYRGYLHLEYEGTGDPLIEVPKALREYLRLCA